MTTSGRHSVEDAPNTGWAMAAGWLVLIGAAVLTVHGLVEVALSATVTKDIAWLYPIITDALALVAYAATAILTGAARRYAATVVFGAAGLSGLAQAAYLAGGAGAASGVLRFGVGAWPAIAAALTAHLLWLLREARRNAAAEAAAEQRRLAAEQRRLADEQAAQRKADADHRAELRVRELEAIARAEEAKNRPQPQLRSAPRKPAAAKKARATAAPAPEIGTGSVRQNMLAFLDGHRDAALAGEITGGALDREFGTNNYGRGVLKAWRDKNDPTAAPAVGE